MITSSGRKVGIGTVVMNDLFKEFQSCYFMLFDKYEELIEKATPHKHLSKYLLGKEIAIIHYRDLIRGKHDPFELNEFDFENIFMCMYGWSKFRIAYNYPEEEFKKRMKGISDLVIEAKYFTEIPYSTFFFEGQSYWRINGILINIRENPIRSKPERKFQIDAIIIDKSVNVLKDINLEESNISFEVSEGQKLSDFWKHDEDWTPVDFIENRNSELKYYVLEVCYFLYQVALEKRLRNQYRSASTNDSPKGQVILVDNDWDDEYIIVYDDLDGKKKREAMRRVSVKEQYDSEMDGTKTNDAGADSTETSIKVRKRPRPHITEGYMAYRICGSGANKHRELRPISGYRTGKDRLNGKVPVIEHQKK